MARKIPPEAVCEKDPNEKADYRVDWGTFLGADNDTIVTGTFSVQPGTLYKESEIQATTYMDIWVSSGTDKVDYEITNTIDTLGGRHWERTILIKVIEK
jgi:hypothetical protein